MSSGAWIASHVFAMVGFILVPIGLLSLWGVAQRVIVRVDRRTALTPLSCCRRCPGRLSITELGTAPRGGAHPV
jgi:hypothetical protein